MSYCRIGEDGSDVYMYSDGLRYFIDTGEESLRAGTPEEAQDTLLRLRERGLRVPQKAISRLEREMEDPEAARREHHEEFLRETQEALGEELDG